MEKAHMLQKQMLRRFELEEQLTDANRQLQEMHRDLAQRKFDLRQCRTAETEYSGLKALADKLSGKFAERQEQLHRESHHAQLRLEEATRALDALNERKRQLEAALASLPSRDHLLTQCADISQDTRQALLRLDAQLSAKRLLPLLKENRDALQQALEWTRPGIGLAEEITQKRIHYYAQADRLAAQCHALLERVNHCGQVVAIHPYFPNPANYIMNSAQEYKKLDKFNEAIAAVCSTEKEIRNFIAHSEVP